MGHLHESDIVCIQHSAMVAKAAYLIASQIGIDPNLAHMCGALHDIGKLHIPTNCKYKHPLIGYDIMMGRNEKTLAEVCITHPFPVKDFEYIKYYCQADTKTAEIIWNILQNIETTPLIQLIQYCDKISGIDNYMTIAENFKWYATKYKMPHHLIQNNYNAYLKIKNELTQSLATNDNTIVNSLLK